MLLAADDNFIFLPKQPSVKCLRLFLCGLDQGIKEETKWNKHKIPKLWFDYIFLKICEMIFFFWYPTIYYTCWHHVSTPYIKDMIKGIITDIKICTYMYSIQIYIYSKLSYIENNSFEVYTFSHDNKEEVA